MHDHIAVRLVKDLQDSEGLSLLLVTALRVPAQVAIKPYHTIP